MHAAEALPLIRYLPSKYMLNYNCLEPQYTVRNINFIGIYAGIKLLHIK